MSIQSNKFFQATIEEQPCIQEEDISTPEKCVELILNDIKKSKQIQHKFKIEGSNEISAVEFVEDKFMLITGHFNSEIKIWDIKSKSKIQILKSHSKKITELRYFNNKLFSSSEDCSVIIWDMQNYVKEQNLRDHKYPIKMICLSPNGKRFASCCIGMEICIYDNDFLSLKKINAFYLDKISFMFFLPTEDILITSFANSSIKFWDINNKTEVFDLSLKGSQIIGLSQYKKYIIIGECNLIRFWNIQEKNEEFLLEKYSNIAGITSSEEILVINFEKKIVFWNIKDQREEFYIETEEKIYGVWISSNKKYVMANTEKNAMIWQIFTKQEKNTIRKQSYSINCIAINEDGNLLHTFSCDGNIYTWCLEDKISTIFKENAHTSNITCMAISPNKEYIATGSENCTVKIETMRDSILKYTLDESIKPCSLEFSHDSNLLAILYEENSIVIYNLKLQKTYPDICIEKYNASAMKFSLDSNFLYYTVCNQVKIWNINQFYLYNKILAHSDNILSLALNSKGKIIATGSMDKTIKLWTIDKNKEKAKLYGHTDAVSSLNFINDYTLLSGSWDCTAKIWNLKEKRLEFELKSHTDKIIKTLCTKDENIIYTLSSDCSIKIWKLFDIKSEKSRCQVSVSLDGQVTYSSKNSTKVFQVNYEEQKRTRITPNNPIISMQNFSSSKLASEENFTFLRPVKSIISPYFQDFIRYFNVFMSFRNNKYENLTAKNCDIKISKFGFTQLHFLAFNGEMEALEKVLTIDSIICADVFGHSPIFYSITMKHSKCTKMLLEHLIKISNNKKHIEIIAIFHAIRNEIVLILHDTTSCLI
ncbi:hypothetical protein SteCoe_33252 [Stentor coeruleus]|uniref:Uncharacterized protein n=1 Tax=Stentor coeruleus TaxID=5963 RepID=A0A1R2AXE4_9CILI|nr:hypothetical protein SteCoe_33252 [Stentor coeruleus]